MRPPEPPGSETTQAFSQVEQRDLSSCVVSSNRVSHKYTTRTSYFRGSKRKHPRSLCSAANLTCNRCKKIGHLTKVCRSSDENNSFCSSVRLGELAPARPRSQTYCSAAYQRTLAESTFRHWQYHQLHDHSTIHLLKVR
ncbi:hypothetical protein GJ496_003757 [Pomphorhynchus laevis]|nr:hypothetical protein GJ496_003757 [Pomphorhynchus laevis]